MWRFVLLAVLCVRLTGTVDLYWRSNTDWAVPDNWAKGRAPCEGETADLSSNSPGSVVFLGSSVTVRSLVLPVGGKLVLGESGSISFSNKASCTVAGVAVVPDIEKENTFVGTEPKYWECVDNWQTVDSQPAKTVPCGKDRAFFPEGHYYSTVHSNASIAVQSLKIREQTVTPGQTSISEFAPEFQLRLKVVPECSHTPSLCPCPELCNTQDGGKAGGSSGRGGGGGVTAAIVVVVLVLIALIILGAVVIILFYFRYRRKNSTPYTKDDLLGEPEDTMGRAKAARKEVASFDNPIYEAGVGKDEVQPHDDGGGGGGGGETEGIAILNPSSSDQYEPIKAEPLVTTNLSEDIFNEVGKDVDLERDKKIPSLNKYEQI